MVRSVLVCGATGKQGGALIRALLEQSVEYEIFALTRNPHGKSAQALLKLSPTIRLIAGNLDDTRSIFHQIRQISNPSLWGVFSVQPIYIGPGADSSHEERQGKALIDAALENGVQHFVYTSVDRGGANSDRDPTDVPHFISKHNIERYLQTRARGGSMSWTILRPVAFFENLVPGFMGKVFATNLKRSLKRGKTLQFVATSDVGHIAALCFTNHERYRNQTLSLAGDELNYDQFQQIFQNETGRQLPTTSRLVTILLNWVFGELGCMFRWFGKYGYGANIASVKQIHHSTKDFASWLREDSQFVTSKVKATSEVSKVGAVIVVSQV